MPSPFGEVPQPKSLLDFQRVLSPTAAVRVSPLCLGAMNFGDAWESMMGSCDKKTVFEILDYFYEQGGNFIDTANNYQNEESEKWVGDWMADRKVRDQIVLATKFTTFYPDPTNNPPRQRINFAGNSTKSLKASLEASLKKLQTDYIDLLYVHWWDNTTSIPELMQSLNHMVASGKVLYLGISDTPAWIVSKANEYARNHGLRPFSVYQGRWSAADRDFERDIIHMARDEGMALCPWGALGGGDFKSEEQRKSAEKGRDFGEVSEKAIKVSRKLEAVAKAKNTQITSIALAYVRSKYPHVYPIVGGRKIEHLKGNIEALALELSQEEVDDIESAVEFDIGFPLNLLYEMGGSKYKTTNTSEDIYLLGFAGKVDCLPVQGGPKPRQL
ncbi:aryl-alcohol dehydrogenase-like protein [Dothidotthia symphoricarpi CBS 119687]|uniref:Aryl-alcohol dehydrogenase-like protein n=1 Tax=Dothidotthia symphoricarpi CBS 119687 TaxID=1392245 RepID=A0A6A6ADV9_9PLEO|nr:aryl-alcohol dehydrogenase-like protein [Dothidotthia symphoricarpi CBS 119687]KAF2129463.1 aryl-alcohol dehydrogenase-like protein [Dothidotthia symphoricarpi CBS 119687]